MTVAATDFLSERALRLLEHPTDDIELRAEYERMGVVQVDGFADPGRVVDFEKQLYPRLSPLCTPSIFRHKIVDQKNGTGYLTLGQRFSRVDPGSHDPGSKERALYEKEFLETGLTAFGEEIGELVVPFVEHIVGAKVTYQRIYCFIYEEGDYIGPHNDSQIGWRVNVQFPIPYCAVTGFRVSKDGEWKLYYDMPGSLRILGPDVWHEVLPVLRLTEEAKPHRMLLSLRFR